MRKEIKNISKENPFDFREYVKKQKDDDEIDIGFKSWFV